MTKLANLKGVKTLSRKEQKNIFGERRVPCLRDDCPLELCFGLICAIIQPG